MTTTAPSSAASDTEPHYSHRRILIVLIGLLTGMFMSSLDQTIVGTAMPKIVSEFGGTAHIAWVTTAYLLGTSITMLIWGKLGDLFGRKTFYLICVVLFIIGSALCGQAHSMAELIGFRAFQGVGGGGLMVLAQACIADVIPPRERGRYQGLFGAVFGLSSIAGPLIGGYFTDHSTWRWVFYVNVPVGILALIAAWYALPAMKNVARVSIDYAGFALVGLTVTCLTLFTSWTPNEYGWNSPQSYAIGALTLAFGVLFIVRELHTSNPVIPLHLFRLRSFTLSSIARFILGFGMMGSMMFLPLFLQICNGRSATNSGLLMLPMMAGFFIASITSGQLITKYGRYKIYPIVGLAIGTIGMGLLSTMVAGTSQMVSGFYMFIFGFGLGLGMQVYVLIVQNDVPRAEMGTATSTVTFFQSIGGSFGVAIFGTIFSSQFTSQIKPVAAEMAKTPGLDPALTSALTGPSIASGNIPPQLAKQLTEYSHQVPAIGHFIDTYAGVITSLFRYAIPILILGLICTLFIKEIPLRGFSHPIGGSTGSSGTSAPGGTGASQADVETVVASSTGSSQEVVATDRSAVGTLTPELDDPDGRLAAARP